ncbi:helix-turn-helix domain-containing protein [Bacillus salipaludis]|uniref:helix-turn-helix domain-containing protein n=1 Tax=Bacillus salipaludis TaxID=2547811 RepID=UPI002E1E51FD|nr:helix-turn-helix domain-containing protein [Bacillus salipaludis]
MNPIGRQLRKIRINREMEREKLALLAGISVETIAAIEEEEMDVQVSALYKLSDALNCTFAIGMCRFNRLIWGLLI